MVLENYTEAKNYFRCIEVDLMIFKSSTFFCFEYLKAHEEAVEILNGLLKKTHTTKLLG